MESAAARIDLYWIPLGFGGTGFVRLNGRLYEKALARLEHRSPLDLYHTALQVHVPAGRYVIETMWPSPDTHLERRGVRVTGPVWHPYLGRFRPFRYEIRCWRDGELPDAGAAIGGPVTVSRDIRHATAILASTAQVPPLVWGRDEAETGEMWNSNSVISWLLALSGVPLEDVAAPAGGRAPGWLAGIRCADRSSSSPREGSGRSLATRKGRPPRSGDRRR